MPRLVSESEFSQISKSKPNNLITTSFNKQTTLNDKTKLVIVGTLTPPSTKYFYCAHRNRIYGYIDESIKELGFNERYTLKELKNGLSEHKNGTLASKQEAKKKIEAIKEILTRHGIAFLDVMNNVIRKNNNSHDDKDIEYYTLAIKDFENIDSSATIIVNSKLANECVKRIGQCMGLGIKVKYLSQRCGSKDEWIKAIVEALR